MPTDTTVGTAICTHCEQRIHLVNHQLGPKWMHHGPHSDYEFCITTRAEPTPQQVPAQREHRP